MKPLLDSRHRQLWAVWLAMVAGTGVALEAWALLDEDHDPDDPDTLTFAVREMLAASPVLWLTAAGITEWCIHHFLSPTVPWTRRGPHGYS